MRILCFLAIAATTLTAGAPVWASQSAGRSNPYAGLFTGRLPAQAPAAPARPAPQLDDQVVAELRARAEALARVQPRPVLVCGLTIVPGDTGLDRRILRPVPEGAAKPIIRTMTPTACQAP